MKKDIIILGSTGSIGKSVLKVLNKSNEIRIKLLVSNKNAKKLLFQAKKFNVKNVIINNLIIFNKYKKTFNKNNINLHYGFKNIKKIVKKKVYYCVNSISGIEGFEPTLKFIPLTKNILIANKESIICGWHIISKQLKLNKTNFIPLDSEHFSIWDLLSPKSKNIIDKVILTASGGPFLKKSLSQISNIKPYQALKHPNWKMGKKISIDSSTMMNKVFEYIEAIKLFNLEKNQLSILIHPKSFVHAIIFFKGETIKFLAHETKMTIPIMNALGLTNKNNNRNIEKKNLLNLDNFKFQIPNKKKFPFLKIIDLLPKKISYFETILITINDTLVDKFLNGKINYKSLQTILLDLIKKPYLKRYYKLKPNNIYDIKKMILITKKYVEYNYKNYEN